MRVGYFTMEYPRATDTFIQREVAAVRDLDIEVVTLAARRPGDDHMVGDEQRAERERTHYLLPASAAAILSSQARLVLRHPGRWLRGVALAASTARPGLRGGLYQLFYFLEAGLLAARVDEHELDHLHAHFGDVATSVAMLAGALSGRPFSFTLHGPGVFFDAHVWHLGTKIERADFVACISWFCRSQAQLLSSEAMAEKLHIIHCGVDPARYDTTAPTPEASDDVNDEAESSIRLAFVARLDHVKGVTVLLDAMAEVRATGRDVRLSIVGDGPSRSDFVAAAERLGVSHAVDFLGYRNSDEVATVLRESDVFVLPSFAEGVPVSLMEASASGLPVIATNVGGVTELVEDDVTGFVLAPGDTSALAARITQLADDPALRARLGAAGRGRVAAEFESRSEAARLAQLFRRHVDRRSHAGIGVRPALGPVGSSDESSAPGPNGS